MVEELYDIGLVLSLKDDSKNRDFTTIVNEINVVVEKYGYKVQGYGSWENFRKMCVEMEEFIQCFNA